MASPVSSNFNAFVTALQKEIGPISLDSVRSKNTITLLANDGVKQLTLQISYLGDLDNAEHPEMMAELAKKIGAVIKNVHADMNGIDGGGPVEHNIEIDLEKETISMQSKTVTLKSDTTEISDAKAGRSTALQSKASTVKSLKEDLAQYVIEKEKAEVVLKFLQQTGANQAEEHKKDLKQKEAQIKELNDKLQKIQDRLEIEMRELDELKQDVVQLQIMETVHQIFNRTVSDNIKATTGHEDPNAGQTGTIRSTSAKI